MTHITTQKQALEYLYDYIPDGMKYRFPGDVGLRRTKYLLSLLGNPQEKTKVVHIAGTSGKTSTCYFMSILLQSQGYRVGLHISPHMQDIRERFQINNKLISEQQFCAYLTEIVPTIESMQASEYGLPTYFEVTVALAYYIFWKEKVEYAVVETGLGGLLDGTNVVNNPNKLAIISTIGHDHTDILGKTLEKIAAQKAGIIQRGNTVVTIKQHPKALDVIKKEAEGKKATLYIIDRSNIKHISLTPEPQFDFHFLHAELKKIKIHMRGSFQVQNCALALAALTVLSKRDGFILDEKKIIVALAKALYPGRMQVFTSKKETVIIDGAHNPQKMAMFTKNLSRYYPAQKYTFLIAFKRGKDYRNILKYITPLAEKIIITSFFNQTEQQGFSVLAKNPYHIAKILDKMQFNNYHIVENTADALQLLYKEKNPIKVITGSMYLASEVYPHIRLLFHE